MKEKNKVGDRHIGEEGTRRQEKKEQKRGEKALFRQPDNLPSQEHIYGCPPHSINLLIVRTEPVVLASLSISHYLSRRGVLPAHTSAGLDKQSLIAIHQLLPTLPYTHEPSVENTLNILRSDHICWI